MEITIFAKHRINDEGKQFINYISRLTKKNGEETPVQVKFKDNPPKAFPCNIKFDPTTANLSSRNYTDKLGEVRTSHTLWISEWEAGSEYVDHSLDDYLVD